MLLSFVANIVVIFLNSCKMCQGGDFTKHNGTGGKEYSESLIFMRFGGFQAFE